jgi:excisionase family DNA binding protein
MSKNIEVGELAARLAFSRREAALLIGVTERHLIEEIKRGKLRESHSGRRRLISRRELERYLAASGEQHEPTNAAA